MAIKAISLSPCFLVICPDNRGVVFYLKYFLSYLQLQCSLQFAVMWLPTAVSMSVHC